MVRCNCHLNEPLWSEPLARASPQLGQGAAVEGTPEESIAESSLDLAAFWGVVVNFAQLFLERGDGRVGVLDARLRVGVVVVGRQGSVEQVGGERRRGREREGGEGGGGGAGERRLSVRVCMSSPCSSPPSSLRCTKVPLTPTC